MSSAVGLASTSKNMGFDENKVDDKEGTPVSETNVTGSDHVVPVVEPETEDEDDEDVEGKIQLGPKCTLKELSEKDKVRCFLGMSIFSSFISADIWKIQL